MQFTSSRSELTTTWEEQEDGPRKDNEREEQQDRAEAFY